MPQLQRSNIVDIELPSSTPDDPATVKFDTTLTTKQALDIAGTDDKTQAMIGLMTECIKQWNFVDGDGNTEPITVENVGKLSLDDFTVLAEYISKAVDDVVGAKRVGLAEKKA